MPPGEDDVNMLQEERAKALNRKDPVRGSYVRRIKDVYREYLGK